MASELKNLSTYSEKGIITKKELKKHIFPHGKLGSTKIGIVVSEWNEQVTSNLATGAVNTLKKYGFDDNDIILQTVPGSFELPLAAKYMIINYGVEAVICLGCVIQGETKHFDFVCQGVTQGIMQLNLSSEKPIAFGLLTTNNLQQALERAGGRLGNKGDEAAVAVLKMLNLKIGEKSE